MYLCVPYKYKNEEIDLKNEERPILKETIELNKLAPSSIGLEKIAA
jgi:hypothetical protein